MINCFLLVLLLLVSMVLLKCTKSPLVFHFLNFVQFFHLQLLLMIILPVFFVIFFHPYLLMITLAKILFLTVSQIKNANHCRKFFDSCNVTSFFTNIPLQQIIDIAINLIFNQNPNVTSLKKNLNNFSFLLHQRQNFIFNSNFYNQINGVAMGSPYNLNTAKFYLRYFYDILAAFDC